MQKSIPVFHFLQKVEMKDMETSSATSKLMVLECDEELQQSDKIMRKRNIGSVIMYSMIIAMMTLLSVNTVILEQKKKDKITSKTLEVRDYIQWTKENSTLSRCPNVDKFPLSEDIFVHICVNEKQSNLTIIYNI